MKVLLVDDHAMMRDGLRAVLEKEKDVEVVNEAANGREAIELTKGVSPDVIVMDIGMPGLNGIDATRAIVAENPKAKVVCLSVHADRHYVLAMFDAGAVGYLLKDAASGELITAIRAAVRGQVYVSPEVAGCLVASVRSPDRPANGVLSAREREVLQLIAEGKASKEIAVALDLALPTVETHRRAIAAKLGLRTVAELTKYAIREGLTIVDK